MMQTQQNCRKQYKVKNTFRHWNLKDHMHEVIDSYNKNREKPYRDYFYQHCRKGHLRIP